MLKFAGGLAVAMTAAVMGSLPQAAEAEQPRPNIVLITADDMRLDDLRWMPHTRELLNQFKLKDFISNHPLCCPARAQLLTGQFAQNNGVFHNKGPFGGYPALIQPDNNVASWLHDTGYQTGFVGKFLNFWSGLRGSAVPGGWDHFNGWDGALYSPYDWTDFNDGDPVKPGLHSNDGVTAEAAEQVSEFSNGSRPFFIWASYVAPHAMTDASGRTWGRVVPAERHNGTFAGVAPPYQKKPSFRYKHHKKRVLAQTWRKRIESLQSVDEGVRDLYQVLQNKGELEDTVVIFTSDNGFALGEHRAKGKNLPWEEVLRVPLVARGPGLPSGRSSKGAMFVDLAPSIAKLAGATPGREVDGRSDLFALDGGWDSTLIQAGSDDLTRHFSWRGTRTARWTYVHWLGGRKELYDRKRDRYQLRNLAGKRPRVQHRLAALTPKPY